MEVGAHGHMVLVQQLVVLDWRWVEEAARIHLHTVEDIAVLDLPPIPEVVLLRTVQVKLKSCALTAKTRSRPMLVCVHTCVHACIYVHVHACA